MGIRPIDLSTVYTQLDNVAKFGANQNQNAALASSINANTSIKEDMQKNQAVQETAKDTDSAKIKEDGHNSEDQEESEKKENQETEPEEKPVQQEIKDPLLGNRIDIIG